LAIPLPDKAKVRNLVVRPHTLTGYDQLDKQAPAEQATADVREVDHEDNE
jgi:hypothetical protein